ncbi:hypothetical protein HNY73_008320 [Argiope bruennichi]|uniref:Uncharacterized protein n=1 Tax=Argiope bruennichi TaxID=94029 RepID=A0A8T0F8D0_ARGBR|nr:hypothetical protein HNY73_008320 [Argiope bruennichi]
MGCYDCRVVDATCDPCGSCVIVMDVLCVSRCATDTMIRCVCACDAILFMDAMISTWGYDTQCGVLMMLVDAMCHVWSYIDTGVDATVMR